MATIYSMDGKNLQHGTWKSFSECTILALESRWGKLTLNRHRGGNELNQFMEESYNLPQRQQLRGPIVVHKTPCNSDDHQSMKSVNQSLAVEVTTLNEHVFNIPKNYFAVPRNQRVGVEQTLQEVQWFPDLAVRV